MISRLAVGWVTGNVLIWASFYLAFLQLRTVLLEIYLVTMSYHESFCLAVRLDVEYIYIKFLHRTLIFLKL